MLTLILCPFHPRVTAVARKRPRSCCQKCKWQVTPKHAYTLDPSKSERADYAAVRAECGNLSGYKLTHNSSGNTRPQSSQLAEPLWTDPGLKRRKLSFIWSLNPQPLEPKPRSPLGLFLSYFSWKITILQQRSMKQLLHYSEHRIQSKRFGTALPACVAPQTLFTQP